MDTDPLSLLSPSKPTFIIYDRHARSVGSHQIEFTQFYPEAGWVEHDPMEILESVRVCMAKAMDKATADGHVDIGLKAIGLTNQRTLLLFECHCCPYYLCLQRYTFAEKREKGRLMSMINNSMNFQA